MRRVNSSITVIVVLIGLIIAMVFATAVVIGSSLVFAIVIVQSPPAFAIAIVSVHCCHYHSGSKEA